MPTVLITGGHKGIGLQASRTIARMGGHDLLLCGRDVPAMQRVADDLHREFGSNVQTAEVDISSLGSVRDAAKRCKGLIADKKVASLAALLLNAGAQFPDPPTYGADGYELTFATNCLGHFLLLNLLIDDLLPRGRIVFTASGTHDPETTDGKIVGKAIEADAFSLANQGRKGAAIVGGRRYTTSKLCTIMFAYELDRKLRRAGSDILSVAYDPGMVSETDLTASIPKLAKALLKTRVMKRVLRALGVTIGNLQFSGAMLGRLAAASEYANVSGKFMQSRNGRSIEQRSSTASYDAGRAAKLWHDCVELTGLQPAEQSRLLTRAEQTADAPATAMG